MGGEVHVHVHVKIRYVCQEMYTTYMYVHANTMTDLHLCICVREYICKDISQLNL